jgi:hypothetical protein
MKKAIIKHQNDYKFAVKLDIEEDAWNWFFSCNRNSHGVDWKNRVSPDIYKNIHGKTKKEARDFLIPFLEQKYIDEKDKIDKHIDFITDVYNQKLQKACKKLEEVMGKPIYRNDFTFFITTFPCGPYNYSKGYVWEYIGWNNPVMGFLHELAHFQFIHYWRNNPDSDVSKLSDAQFEWLKESLTMILDRDFLPLIECVDIGYDIHQPLRSELHKFWKTNHNFDKLVELGVKLIPKYVK